MEHEDFLVTEDILASKNKRFVNHLIDLVPQYAFSYFLAYFFFYLGEFTGNYSLNDYLNTMNYFEELIVTYAFFLLYFFIMESLTFKTLGKYVTKTKVVLPNGKEPSKKDIIIRSLCRMIPFDGLSFLGTNGKGWHDSISKTYVVDEIKFNNKRKFKLELELIGKPVDEID
ncbi:RDD family protein [Seonamhaeicola sp. MEBiC1930]|uniref:RDD family protein n=1 Tax=Seonamhaeicola sp. MEBiC01930 TaxID=2976768 RepID=UPI00324F9C10